MLTEGQRPETGPRLQRTPQKSLSRLALETGISKLSAAENDETAQTLADQGNQSRDRASSINSVN